MRPDEAIEWGPVVLRRWRVTDAEELSGVVVDALDHLRPWMPWADGYDLDAAVTFLTNAERDWEADVTYDYSVRTENRIVGSCGLLRRIGPGGLDIGYWLHQDYTGRGLMTRAVQAVVDQAFGMPDIDRVEIHHDPANTASAGIPRRLGFTEAGLDEDGSGNVVWRLTRPGPG